jgi:AhpD family alkylhydroperoxidase
MAGERIPKHYEQMRKDYPGFISALEGLGSAVREAGPLDEKTVELLGLAAAASMHSEGAVLSHARRALDAGASKEEINHALIAVTSTIGFPTVAAALNWVHANL